MTFHPKVRDSQNSYRTGVLVENFVEDGVGQELAKDPRIGHTGITEKQAKHSMASTLMAYDIPERDQAAILVSVFLNMNFFIQKKSFFITETLFAHKYFLSIWHI